MISLETELQIDMIVLVARWSWKGCLSVTLEKPQLCTFIVQVFSETELQAILPTDKAVSGYDSFSGKIVLKGHSSVKLEKLWLCMFIVEVSKDTASSQYNS